MSSILRKLTGAIDFDEVEDGDDAMVPEQDLRESLRNKFIEDEYEEEPQNSPPVVRDKSVEEPLQSTTSQDSDISSGEGVLTIDVYQTENDIVIVSTIAGVTSKDLDVTITNDMVTIKGERKNRAKVKHDDYFYQECYWGSFSRSVILPIDVDAENAEAELKDGVLIVKLPKSEKVKSKKIPIK
jgi:HSP20 family protein